VACGAKTWTIPLTIPDSVAASWTLSVMSMKLISPLVEKLYVLFMILKGDILITFKMFSWLD